jgi:N6-adenosine-specific RNA methylase IME4
VSICETSSGAIAQDQVADERANIDWVVRLNTQWDELRNRTVDGFVRLGNDLIAAKKAVEHGGFGAWCEKNLRFSWDTANGLMQIARWIAHSDPDRNLLPPDWTTLRQLARLDGESFTQLVQNGTIKQNATRREIEHQIKLKKRVSRHAEIAEEAKFKAKLEVKEGQFALIYADPPWTFETLSERGIDRSPDNHYPTLSDEAIAGMLIDGYTVPQIAADDSALFLWCTSSNLKRALAVMKAWGFAYKTHFMWDKEQTGTGYWCRNQHEVLLLGTRGQPPLPIEKFSSVYREKKTKHSVKPAGIRKLIEAMFPMFDEHSRIEMFARGAVSSWTVWGLEAVEAAA